MTTRENIVVKDLEGRYTVQQRVTKDYIIREPMYYVYILTNKTDKVMYIGVTNNLQRRLYEHKNKLIDGFTKKYHIHKLVYYEDYKDINSAISREKQLKGLLRTRKNQLVETMNPTWEDLTDRLLPHINT